MKTTTKLSLAIVLGLVAVIVALVAIKGAQIGKMINAGKGFTPPPESVSSATAQAVEWEGTRGAVASLVAVRAVMLGSELAGTVRHIGFDSGAYVKRGTLMVKLDTSTEEAQLAAARADALLARDNLARARRLKEGGANTQADLDAAEARAKAAEASVATLEATIAKKAIRAPFDGRVAIRQVELGQVLQSGAPIASLQSVSPIYAEFWMPQQALSELKVGQRVRMRVDIFPDAHWDGEVTTVNPEVDVATRNVRVRATFPNPDGRLKPGMYANIEVLSSQKRRVITIPVTAVVYAPYGDSVYVIEEKRGEGGKVERVARQRFVRLGERRGDFVAVETGLTAGEHVVSSGAFKLRNGMAVAVNDALGPPAELKPRPADR